MTEKLLDIHVEDIEKEDMNILAKFANKVSQNIYWDSNSNMQMSFNLDEEWYYIISYDESRVYKTLWLKSFPYYIVDVLDTYSLDDIGDLITHYKIYLELLKKWYEIKQYSKAHWTDFDFRLFEFEKENPSSYVVKLYEEWREIYEMKHKHFETDIKYNKDFLHIWDNFTKDNILYTTIIKELPTSGNEEFVEAFIEDIKKWKNFNIEDSVNYQWSWETIHTMGTKIWPYNVNVKFK